MSQDVVAIRDDSDSRCPSTDAGTLVDKASFLGRARELAEVAELLELSRLVTLTGPKTRLARKILEQDPTSGDGAAGSGAAAAQIFSRA